MSWLAAILAALTTIISIAGGIFVGNPPSLVVKILAFATAAATVIRGLIKDFGGPSDPVVSAAMAAGAQAGGQAAVRIQASK